MTRTMTRAAVAGLAALLLATGTPTRPAQADQDFNMIAAASLAIIGAGMIGDHIRGNDIWAEGPEEPARIAFGVGAANVRHDNEADGDLTSALFRVEGRLPVKLWRFTPIVGLELTDRGSFYGYGGVALDVFFGERVVVTPNAALGYYNAGDGRDLGYPLEFRTGIEAAWQFEGGSRLGLAYHHISNAELGERNPGIETLTVNFAVPLGAVFGD
ncbi:acyloxyacyl hydrolase [uncultured Rhodospira sp.]|uniref:acyloxyacyl hydrolase n=1 Tax=uncultured Rhodospira sp. TaxID=1936189 RepID=UPI00262B7ACE|nr:acyloxyacyl hydrolase [uncultured Rhodospira sp.]